MGGEIQAKDVMQRNVITVSPDLSLAQARDIFARSNISGAPVVDEEGLCGVISLADIVRVALSKDFDDFPDASYFLGFPAFYTSELSGSLNQNLEQRLVEDAMTEYVYTVTPDERISVVALTMRQHHIHRVIVVEGANVVGIITTLDLIQVLEKH